MKIKTDFVTNSSSTCYVMSAIVSGSFTLLSKTFEGLAEHYPNQEFVYKDYVHIKIDGSMEKAYHDSEPEYDIDLVLDNEVQYDKDNNERFLTLFKLFINLLNPYQYEMEDRVKEFLETLLFKQLNQTMIPSQLTYFAWPSDVYGDGWDGGDNSSGPCHEYEYKHQVYQGESKLGIFSILNSNIVAEIGGIRDQMQLNQMALDQMNTTGFCLEEQNDKDSELDPDKKV